MLYVYCTNLEFNTVYTSSERRHFCNFICSTMGQFYILSFYNDSYSNSVGKIGNTELYWEDILMLVLFFVLVLVVGFWSSCKYTKNSVSSYFLANRSMHWFPIGASLFASNIGSGHFIGLASAGARFGIGMAAFELNAQYILLILGWLFVPVYMASGIYTMPEYLRKRFGGRRIGIYLSTLTLCLYVFTKISADLYAGAIFIKQTIKLDLYGSILALLIISALFTISGGLTAVMWTDSVQTVLMINGAFILMLLTFEKVGGYKELMEKYPKSKPGGDYVGYDINNQSCSALSPYYDHLLRPASDPDLPWPGVTFGSMIPAVWYWCTDQVIVQRVLSAKNIIHARGGCIFACYIKLLTLFLLVLPGMAARVLYPDIIGCSKPEKCQEECGNKNGCTNIAYPLLILNLMPAGARGMMMFVLLAALTSSLTSIFNSSSTIFTMDIWKSFRKQATQTELLIVGRIFILIFVGISIAWIPIIQMSQIELFHYIQSISSYLSPPICAIYLLAILWPRINEKGAFWGLIAGFVIGMIRFVLELNNTVPPCLDKLPDPTTNIISKINYLHFGIILFVIVSIITIAVSLSTEAIAENQLYRLTFWSRYSAQLRDNLDVQIILERRQKRISNRMHSVRIQDDICVETSSENSEVQQNIKKSNQITVDGSKPSLIKRTFYTLCGLNNQEMQKLSPEEEIEKNLDFLKPDQFWDSICNVNVTIILIATSFVWGFFA